MSYSVAQWRKAILSVMVQDIDKKWKKEDLMDAAYDWLMLHDVKKESK